MTASSLRARVEAALEVAMMHRVRIQAALDHLQGKLPQSGAELAAASYPVIASIELLTSRFGKLQDHLGGQLVPLALELAAEPLSPTTTFLDRLLLLEKRQVLPSVAEFRRLRELRNELAHDYPDDPDEAAAALALVVAAVPSLLAVEAALRSHLEALLARGMADA